ncbi:MAG TPA: hypothetical protein VHW00_16615 [Thermoanaerobaculia bacterium]|nr:hypothetical protein [Thermoanaerobaculia bacterium]
MVIRAAGSRHLLVIVDTDRDQLIDQWFVLESADDLDSTLPVVLANASLVHSPGMLRVSAAQEQVIHDFVVPDYEEARSAPPAFSVMRHAGIGLTHVVRKTSYRISLAKPAQLALSADGCADGEDCLPVLDWWWGGNDGGGGTCDSGGPGSNQCSVSSGSSSCSVSCNSGYFACCRAVSGLPACKCVKG